MLKTQTRCYIGLLSLFFVFCIPASTQEPASKDIRTLLNDYRGFTSNHSIESFGKLFSLEKTRLVELEKFWGSEVRAEFWMSQLLVRYLGEPELVKKWEDWCLSSLSKGCVGSGPVPIPLTRVDRNEILSQLEKKKLCGWGVFHLRYIFALSLDSTQSSRALLKQLELASANCAPGSLVKQTLNVVSETDPHSIVLRDSDLTTNIISNAFFLRKSDKQASEVRSIALSRWGTKQLFEIHLNFGPLAELRYHVVLERSGNDSWRFFSVTVESLS